MSDDSESYRSNLLRQLEDKDRDLQRRAMELDHDKVEFDAAKARAKFPAPESGLCPRCWFEKGVKHPMSPARHDQSDRYDLWQCHECGYSREVPTKPW
jgi:hypothetical protein